jgi:photosystem II stability/assembly factor-like uncharacterized protein
VRRGVSKLLPLTLILLGLTLALPAVAAASSGGGWSRQKSDTTAWLDSVTCADATHAWAMAETYASNLDPAGYIILATTDGGATWTAQNAGTSRAWLNSVTCADDTHAWAVGNTCDSKGNITGGIILATTDGVTWSPQSTGTTDAFLGVTCADDTHAWAVGWDPGAGNFNGTILATTDGGATWSPQSAGTKAQLGSVTCADDTHAWAVGTDPNTGGGAILTTTDGGSAWKVQNTKAQLDSVTCADDTHAWAAGWDPDTNSGIILATTNGGVSWKVQSTGTKTQFTSVTCSDDTHAWAVDYNGTILATTNGGATWHPQRSGTTAGLSGVTCTDGNHAWAVGENGTILATSTGGYATPTLTLKFGGLTSGVLKLGKSLTMRGTVRPISFAGGKVTLALQHEKHRAWLRVTNLARTISASGAFSWTCRPAKKGSYRVRATIAKTPANAAATTTWQTFKVK